MDDKKKKILLIGVVVFSVLVIVVGFFVSKNKTTNTYTITFDSNGSSYQIDAQHIKDGELVVKPKDPVREGYTFIEWQVDGKKFDFEGHTITEDLEIVAIWEKNEDNSLLEPEKPEENDNNDQDNNESTNDEKDDVENKDNESLENDDKEEIVATLDTPKITVARAGGVDKNSTINTYLEIDNPKNYNVAIYYSTKEKSGFKLLRTANKADDNTKWYKISIPLGMKYYYKVKFVNSNEFSNYSNVVNYDNSFKTPSIEMVPAGSVDASGNVSNAVKINGLQGKLEIHYSNSKDGSYKVLKTLTKLDDEKAKWFNVSIPLGEHRYFKVRYVSSAGVYSKFSNVVDYDNSFSKPVIEVARAGSMEEDGTVINAVKINNLQGKLEIHYSNSKDGSYKLLKTISKLDDENAKWFYVPIPLGEHRYFKVRYVSNAGVHSSFSNIVDLDNDFDTPIIETVAAGSIDDDGTMDTCIKINKIQGNVEVYYATSANGNYQLLKTVKEADGGIEGWIRVTIPKDSTYFFKVRYVNNGNFSNYSNIISYEN